MEKHGGGGSHHLTSNLSCSMWMRDRWRFTNSSSPQDFKSQHGVDSLSSSQGYVRIHLPPRARLEGKCPTGREIIQVGELVIRITRVLMQSKYYIREYLMCFLNPSCVTILEKTHRTTNLRCMSRDFPPSC